MAAHGTYWVTGDVTAESCWSFGIMACSYAKVHAVNVRGKQMPFPRDWEQVDRYIESNGICVVELGRASDITLLTLDKSGRYQPIKSSDTVKFACVKR